MEGAIIVDAVGAVTKGDVVGVIIIEDVEGAVTNRVAVGTITAGEVV